CREAVQQRLRMEPSFDTCRLVEQIKGTLGGGSSAMPDPRRGRSPSRRQSVGDSSLVAAFPIDPRLRVEDRLSSAVLPFVGLSAEQRDEALVDGLTEEAIMALTQIPGLQVTARHSVMAYKGTAKDVRRIAAELGVKYALEASIRRDRKQVRANLRLIDGQTGLHLWAASFEGRLSDPMRFIRESVIKLQPRLLSLKRASARPQPL